MRKRSDSNNKAPSRNGNQPHVMVMSYTNEFRISMLKVIASLIRLAYAVEVTGIFKI
ncbi:hypothetical protein [Lysinibacillus sp. NPDC056232]|uniref:hypothetical protein n=1 Tax=Lysinibacillus sp. NPDC056232 TaxID=3345756 RepID=UPI0035E06312